MSQSHQGTIIKQKQTIITTFSESLDLATYTSLNLTKVINQFRYNLAWFAKKIS